MDFPVHIPFVDMLGFELVAFEDGRAELALSLREELTNSRDMAHGGVTMTLLDVVMAHAARSRPGEDGRPPIQGVVTIEMKTTFMRPAYGRLRAVGQLVHRTASMAFCEGRLMDESGALLAQSSGTFKYLRTPAPGTRKRQPFDASE